MIRNEGCTCTWYGNDFGTAALTDMAGFWFMLGVRKLDQHHRGANIVILHRRDHIRCGTHDMQASSVTIV